MKFIIENSKLLILFLFNAYLLANTAVAQPCSGHWLNNYPYNYGCISGQIIGPWPSGPDPIGCPVNPVYTGRQSNTFIFDNSTSDFVVDFNAFSSSIVGCAKMQVKINGIFYPLTAANLVELPSICLGSFSYLTVTPDGYITTNSDGNMNGQGRLVFNGVNAINVTISTNDNGGGSVFGNPCQPVVVPIKLKSFTGKQIVGCKAILNWESEIEVNIKTIEVLKGVNDNDFIKIADVMPKGSYSNYKMEANTYDNSFFKLKIIDFDGQYQYSKIINVRSNCDKFSYSVHPNPAQNSVEIKGLRKGDIILVLDAVGGTILTNSSLQNTSKLNVQRLSSGIYYLRVINNGVIATNIKFIKT